jgi:hypothetical protein
VAVQPIFAIELAATLLGVAAVVSALGGCISTILALRKTRDEEHEACLERLRAARAEGERLAGEVHSGRMRDAS